MTRSGYLRPVEQLESARRVAVLLCDNRGWLRDGANQDT